MTWGIKERATGEVRVLELSGRMILGESSEALDDAIQTLIGAGCRALLVDCGGLAQIDSRGLKALVRGFTSMEKREGEFKLMKLQPRVREVLDVTRLLTVIEVYEDEESALRSFHS
ncbi:MAG: STAS domain-containing protein [Acidobacteria bacterium]|nr:STAS domain-containing protein [Acidobacteriota bacterium]